MLGAQLLEARDEAWFHQGFPPREAELAARLSEMTNKYWSNEREIAIGTFVTAPSLEDEHRTAYVRAIHEDGMCDLDFYPEDEEGDDMDRGHMRAVWPAPSTMRSGMLAIQDWDPRAFGYFMYRLSAPDEGPLCFNLLLTTFEETHVIMVAEEGTAGYVRCLCEVPPPQLLFAAVCEWDSDTSYEGVSCWLARIYRCWEREETVHADDLSDDPLRPAVLVIEKVHDMIMTMPVEPAARLLNIIYQGCCLDGVLFGRGALWTHAEATLPEGFVLGELLGHVIPESDLSADKDLYHFGDVLHVCLSMPNDMDGAIHALWQFAAHETEHETFVAENCGLLLQHMCFGNGARDEGLEVHALNCIDTELKMSLHQPKVRDFLGRLTHDMGCGDPCQRCGYFLTGFFDYSRGADQQPPRVLMDWLETTGDVCVYADVLRECFDEEGLKGFVSHLDRWEDNSLERAAELYVAWHPDGGRRQAVWDLMDALQLPWWSGGRSKARRERLLGAVRALGIGRS